MKFSRRTDHDPTPNDFARALAEARAAGRSLFDLTESNPTRVGLPYDEEAIRAALSDRAVLTYEPTPFGLLAAREAVCSDVFTYQSVAVPPQQVVLTASTSEAYSFLFKLLCDPGDEILVPAPSYPLIAHLAALENVGIVTYPLRSTGERFGIDLPLLRQARTPRTRAIIVISPNNPTGNGLTLAEHEALEAMDLPLIVDEVFLHYASGRERRAAPARSAISRGNVLTFALSGLSKRALLPQAKLAWILARGPKAELADALARLELIADTFLSPSAPVQHGLSRLLSATAGTVATLQQRLQRNRDALSLALTRASGAGARLVGADGGWYAVLSRPGPRADDEWADALLARDVVVQPGWLYDFADDEHLVVSLLPDERTFDEGVARMVEVLSGVATAPSGPYR